MYKSQHRPNISQPDANRTGCSLQKKTDVQLSKSSNTQVIQRVLVDRLGQYLSNKEIQKLKDDYPEQSKQIDEAVNSFDTFTYNESRQGLIINAYAPPSSRSFRFSLQEGYTTTSNSNDTNREVAKNLGMQMNLSRTTFNSKFTDEMLDSENGMQYEGASKISGGMGLKEAGLDRTHHLSDSSIRLIVEALHENRAWETYGINWVINWMRALTGQSNVSGLMNLLGTTQQPPSTNDLNTLVDLLSNNPYQVGFGNSNTNQKIVGSFFDGSKTPGGFDSPLTATISMATEGLKNAGVPKDLIEVALARIVDKETGELVSSMTYMLPKYDYKDPFDKGGGGSGQGPFGGSSFNSVSY
jgi:hypothetical protein